MKYFIAYKQGEETYLYVNTISSSVGVSMTFSNAINFITKEDAKNVCEFLNKLDTTHEYLVIKYEYSLIEE